MIRNKQPSVSITTARKRHHESSILYHYYHRGRYRAHKHDRSHIRGTSGVIEKKQPQREFWNDIEVEVKNEVFDDRASNYATCGSPPHSRDTDEHFNDNWIPFSTILELLFDRLINEDEERTLTDQTNQNEDCNGPSNIIEQKKPNKENKENKKRFESSKLPLPFGADRFRPPDDPVERYQQMLFEECRQSHNKNENTTTVPSITNVSKTIPQKCFGSLQRELNESEIFRLLTLPFRASYMQIEKNYFRSLDNLERNSIQEFLKEIINDSVLYSKYEAIITKMFQTFDRKKLFSNISGEYLYKSVHEDVIRLIITNPKFDTRFKELFRKEIVNKMLRRYISFEKDPKDPKKKKIGKLKYKHFLYNNESGDPLLANATPANFEPGTKTIRQLTFKCWTCKYYYQIGRTQREFYQFQFKDFCSLQCLSTNVNNNGRCSYCYLKKNHTNSANDPKLDWSQCRFTFTLYHPDDIGRDYLEIFHDETHQKEYLESNRFCEVCKMELIRNLDEIHQIQISEQNVLYLCSKHHKEFQTRYLESAQILCTICHKYIPRGTYCEDQFFVEHDSEKSDNSLKLAFCSKACKLLFFKVNFSLNRCSVCFEKLEIDPNDPDYKLSYYMIRCLWTLYTVCSPKCYFNFRYHYRFQIKCHECSLMKYHSDMIGVMHHDNVNNELSDDFIKHYCSPRCLRNHRTEQQYHFHPLPLSHKKYRYDTRIERDFIQKQCQSCSRLFTTFRGSSLEVCSWICFRNFYANPPKGNLTNEEMCDEIFYSEISKQRIDEQRKRRKEHIIATSDPYIYLETSKVNIEQRKRDLENRILIDTNANEESNQSNEQLLDGKQEEEINLKLARLDLIKKRMLRKKRVFELSTNDDEVFKKPKNILKSTLSTNTISVSSSCQNVSSNIEVPRVNVPNEKTDFFEPIYQTLAKKYSTNLPTGLSTESNSKEAKKFPTTIISNVKLPIIQNCSTDFSEFPNKKFRTTQSELDCSNKNSNFHLSRK